MKKIYLSTAFANQHNMQLVRDVLVKAEYEITSHWIDIPSFLENEHTETWPIIAYGKATHDMHDIDKSDLMIQDIRDLSLSKGGTHVELGYALAIQVEVWLIGQPFNVFHYAEGVVHFDNWRDVFVKLDVGSVNTDIMMQLL